MKKIIYFLSALALLFFSACNNNNALPVPVTDIAFEPALPTKPISLTIGKTYQLKAKVQPDNATNRTLTYTSDNPTIASVNDKGVITAHKTGSAKITVQAAGGIAKDITVTITPKPEMPIAVRSIELSPNEDTISVVMGTSRQLNVQVKPENAADKKLSFSSSDEGIASINGEGLVTAKAVGNANITINAANGVSKILKVTVTAAPVAVTDIAFDPALPGDPLLLSVGGTCPIHAKAQPENATDKNLTYTSDNEGVAAVDAGGLITAKAVGNAKITINAANGVSKEITVTVTAAHIPVKDIALSPDETAISVENGNTRYISAHVVPESATNKTLSYSSEDETVASVNDEGLITTHNEGTVNITITAVDNPTVSKQVKLTVTKAIVRVTSIEFEDGEPANPVELIIGESYELKLKVIPEDAENSQLRITSSNENVAWPNGDGNRSIKAYHDVGEATVTITSADNPDVKREVRFKTKREPVGPSINVEKSSIQCESNEGDVTFTVKTINGKLDYMPEVVGGGKEWMTFVSKDNTNESTDTVRVHLNQNKTVWYRDAHIKFKDTSTHKYVKAAGKELQVKIIQKRNDNPVVRIEWVHGITPPQDVEKRKVEIGSTGSYHEMPYVFTWDETMTTTFFNTRKITHTFVLSGGYHGSRPDGNQCWAKTDANMLHWWFVQNKDNIEQYKIKKAANAASEGKIFDSTPYEPVYTRGLADNQEDQKSSIANLFREKCKNSGGSPSKGLQWYLFGLDDFELLRNKGYSPALFKDVFNQSNTPIEWVTIRTKKEFENTLKAALNSKKAVGLNRYGAQDNTQHAITLWGAAFDEEDNIIAIYVVDNNDVPNRVFTYGIQYQNGVDIYAEPDYEHNDRLRYNPYFFNYSNNSLSRNHCIGEIITLDKGEAQWEEWKRNNP